MIFNSIEFIFVYLPAVLAVYFLIPRISPSRTLQLAWLAVASLVFYGYWDIRFVPIILVSIAFNYSCGRLMSALPAAAVERFATLVVAIVLNLAALAFYKYGNFAIGIVNEVRPGALSPLAIALPLGISFFTFTQIAYLVDVYRGEALERSLTRYALFVTYFPHLIAGPILHHREMMPQFNSQRSKYPSASAWAMGLTVFAIGLFKKVIIADGFATIADPVFAAASAGTALSPWDAWGGGLAYSLQIYFDFSGYCDMAIGLSQLFGIALPFNFDAPYKSRSIVEFWRRWHITLSRFLRDYLYIPLGGNRRGPALRSVNLFITMLLGGLWHGAGWTFIVWGALHGGFLLINHLWSSARAASESGRRLASGLPYALACLLLTQCCVVIAWVFFRADSIDGAWRVVKAMFLFGTFAETSMTTSFAYCMIVLFYLVCVMTPNVNAMFRGRELGLETYASKTPWSLVQVRWTPSLVWAVATALVFLVALIGLVIVGDGTQFLYFQF